MNFKHDARDWLGGYPYESATPEEIKTFGEKLGFDVVKSKELQPGKGIFGTGCAEYVFRRPTDQTSVEAI